jgi:hypothetical protein
MNLSNQNIQNELPRAFSAALKSVGQNLPASSNRIMDSEALLRQTIEKDPEKGFKIVFKRYYHPLRSHALRFVYTTEVAEDVVSDVFWLFGEMNFTEL